ncbi:hypothetical protein MKX01_039802 [Papaver californicum]|nr:hypothetical protein MKX01_039802 [Papaver californicum]
MKASARSIHQKRDLLMQVQDKTSQSQALVLVSSKTMEGSSPGFQPSATTIDAPGCMVASNPSVPMEIDSNESRKRQSPDDGRSADDVYGWRKYGEKHVKGNQSTRSYYKCSNPNCEAKKQVIRSYEGQTKEIAYKGNHNHPAPQPSNEMAVGTTLFVYNGPAKEITYKAKHDLPAQKNSEMAVEKQTHLTEPNGISGISPIAARNEEISGTAPKMADDIKVAECDDPESSIKCVELNAMSISKTPAKLKQKRRKPSVEVPGECQSPAIVSPLDIQAATPSTVSNSPGQMVTSRTIVPVEVDSHELQQRQVLDSIVQAMPSDLKGPLMAAERLSEDGYNWRKYGQKRISGSEFPRSYYRCTHPNCQVKKQLERSHDGKLTEIIYKGTHDHPKPQPSSRMVVGTILSIQEESDRVSLNVKKDNSSNGHEIASCDTNPKSIQPQELAHVAATHIAATDVGVKDQGPKLNEPGKEVNNDQVPVSKTSCSESNTETSNALAVAVSTHQQSEPSLQIQVYMVSSRDGLPVDSNEKRGSDGSDSGLQAGQSYKKGTSSLIPTERLPDDVYNWRKYGQKHIKGNEFPRSYYRCTYPNCQVKKQLGLSHDGRIIEIIYKGKHDHPKPLPRGAILSVQDERSDGKLSNEEGQSQTSHYIKIIGANEHPVVMASDDDMESPTTQSNRVSDDVEGDDDPQSKRRKKDVDDLDVSAMGRAVREPRYVVEKPSEVDVVDDGYRWHKYGRKMVKGNTNPRNYYRCSNSGCSMKKHVERASHNPKLLITTYEGKHNHDMPAPRTYSNEAVTPKLGSEEHDADTIDNIVGAGGAGSSPQIRMIEDKHPSLDQVAAQDINHSKIPLDNIVDASPLTTCFGGVDGDKRKEKQNDTPSFDNPPP